MERNGVREVVRDGLGCAVVLAVLGIGGAAMLAGVAAHAHGARKKIEEKRTSAAVAQTLRDGSEQQEWLCHVPRSNSGSYESWLAGLKRGD